MAANNKSKKKLFIFGGLALLAVILILVVVFGSKRENVITIQTEAARRTITQVVTASGKIQPETQVKINAEVSGEIILLPVKEGQSVRRESCLSVSSPINIRHR